MPEEEYLEEEIKNFKQEQEKIRKIIGAMAIKYFIERCQRN